MSENKNATILTVDDNDALRYSLSRTLQGGGYLVIEARNGAEALRLAENCPDLITLDVHLPCHWLSWKFASSFRAHYADALGNFPFPHSKRAFMDDVEASGIGSEREVDSPVCWKQ